MAKRGVFDSVRDWFSPKVEPPKAPRADSLVNGFLGFGTGRDKLSFGQFSMNLRLSDEELDAMYYGDDASARIVNKAPREMLRRGYKLVSKKNSKRAEEIQRLGQQAPLNVDTKVLRLLQWGRWRGGAVLVLGANDSADLTQPLTPGAVREVKFLNVIDRRFARVQRYQENASLPGYGEPELYDVGNFNGGAYQSIHASRLVRYVGVEETDPVTMRALGGWSFSVLQRPYEIIRDFATSYKSVAHLLSDASQGVWKIQNLLDMLATDRDALVTRMQFSDMTRSAGRSIMLDAENEDFTRVATSFAGLNEVLDRLTMRVASSAGMPVTVFMGRSPAGLNATGESDIRGWYDELASDQKNELRPILLAVYAAIAGANCPDDLDVEFSPLWEPTDAEKAQTSKTRAETYKTWVVDIGSLTPGQAAIAEFGSGNGKVEIDEPALRATIETDLELMKDRPDPSMAAAVEETAPEGEDEEPPPDDDEIPVEVEEPEEE